MARDPIIAEIRRYRDEFAKRFNYDLHAIIEDARQRQAASGRKGVSFPPRPVQKPVSENSPQTDPCLGDTSTDCTSLRTWKPVSARGIVGA
jgi:hypothetical protein